MKRYYIIQRETGEIFTLNNEIMFFRSKRQLRRFLPGLSNYWRYSIIGVSPNS